MQPTTPTCASTCWRCCRRRGAWCAPAWPRTIRRSSRSAPSSRRRRWIRGSGSSATSWSATMCMPPNWPSATTPSIYAVGAQSDRSLGIPGEDLPGSVAAVDFVGWYNAHPHFEEMAPDLSTGRAIVVGNGNVALDVARILVTDPDVLAATDIADHALKSLHDRGVEEVVIVGRRGPLQAPFTTLELRELGDLEGLGDVDVIVDPADFADISDEDLEAAGKTVRNNIKVLRGYAERTPSGAKRRIVFRFRTSPIEIKGDGRVESIVLGRNELVDDDGRIAAKDTGEREEVPAQLVVRAVGYRGVPTPGLPFDERRRHHPAHRRPGGRQPQRVRRRLDQTRTHRGDRQQQEGLAGNRRHPAVGPVRARSWPTSTPTTPTKLVEWLLAATAEAGHRRPLEADRRPRTLSGSAARPAAGQADQRRRPAAHRPRLRPRLRPRVGVTRSPSAAEDPPAGRIPSYPGSSASTRPGTAGPSSATGRRRRQGVGRRRAR